MQAIYTRTMKVKDNSLGEAMEIGKSLAKVRKKYYPKHNIYFSFQIIILAYHYLNLVALIFHIF